MPSDQVTAFQRLWNTVVIRVPNMAEKLALGS
ncbi:MAG: hypothetical protein RL519_935 [Pseudomonadota bacterium]|jgi:hypothetical protein